MKQRVAKNQVMGKNTSREELGSSSSGNKETLAQDLQKTCFRAGFFVPLSQSKKKYQQFEEEEKKTGTIIKKCLS